MLTGPESIFAAELAGMVPTIEERPVPAAEIESLAFETSAARVARPIVSSPDHRVVRKPRPMPGTTAEARAHVERKPRAMPATALRPVEPVPAAAPPPGARRAIVCALAEWVVADLVRHPAPA
jgi:hypothetical protein